MITIITSVYNEEKYITSHIEYLIGLEYYGIDHILIDGRSNDQTINIIKSYLEKTGRGVICKSKIYEAWNIGLKMLKPNCKYICFLGVGDRLGEDYISSSIGLIKSSSPDLIHVGDNPVPMDLSCWNTMKFQHAGTFFSVDLFREIGGFDEKYTISGDFEWVLRLIKYAKKNKRSLNVAAIKTHQNHMRSGGVSDGKCGYIWINFKEDIFIYMKYKVRPSFRRILFLLWSAFKCLVFQPH